MKSIVIIWVLFFNGQSGVVTAKFEYPAYTCEGALAYVLSLERVVSATILRCNEIPPEENKPETRSAISVDKRP